MRKFLILSGVAVLGAAAAGVALADDSRARVDVPRDQWLTIQQLAERFETQGLQVREIDEDKGGYEVEYVDREGRSMEAKVHPATGEILKSRIDD